MHRFRNAARRSALDRRSRMAAPPKRASPPTGGAPQGSADRGLRRSRAAPLAIVAALGLVGAGVAWRAGSSRTTDDPMHPVASSAVTSVPTTPLLADAAAPPTSAPSLPVSVTTGAPSHVAMTSASAPIGQRAQVMLLGDPGTQVSVDGSPKGACPVRVNLEPGQHDVRFVFDATGESRGERLSVRSGDKMTVRAEFTGASPTVKIYR